MASRPGPTQPVDPIEEDGSTPAGRGPTEPVECDGGAGPLGWSIALSLLAASVAAATPTWPIQPSWPATAVLVVALAAWGWFLVDLFRSDRHDRPRGRRAGGVTPRRSALTAGALVAVGALVEWVTLVATQQWSPDPLLAQARSTEGRAFPALVLASVLVLQWYVLGPLSRRLVLRRWGRGVRRWFAVVVRGAPWALVLVGSGAIATLDRRALGWPILAVGAGVVGGVTASAWAGTTGRLVPGPSGRRIRSGTTLAAAAVVAAVLIAGFTLGAHRQITTFNTYPDNGHDQASYLRYAAVLHDRPDQVVENRLQMPLYPYLLSLVDGTTGDWAGRFDAALRISVAIALIGMAGIAFWAWRTVGPWAAFVSTAIVGFSMFLFLGTWILSDVLGALLLTAFLGAGWRLLQRPSALLGALTGALAGLTHLAKTIVTAPSLLLVALLVLGALCRGATNSDHEGRRTAGSYLAAATSMAVLFVSVVAPYAANSERVYGSPTYNVVTDYYVWYDRWDEAEQGTRAAGDQRHAPDLPAALLPSPTKYLREHRADDIAGRLTTGWAAQWEIAVTGRLWEGYFGYGWTMTLLIAVTLTALVVAGRRARSRLRRDRLAVTFVTGTLVGLSAATSWWFAIGSGNRYLLPTMLAGTLVCVWAIHRALSPLSFRIGTRVLAADTFVFAVMAIPIAVISAWNVLELAGTTPGGY